MDEVRENLQLSSEKSQPRYKLTEITQNYDYSRHYETNSFEAYMTNQFGFVNSPYSDSSTIEHFGNPFIQNKNQNDVTIEHFGNWQFIQNQNQNQNQNKTGFLGPTLRYLSFYKCILFEYLSSKEIKREYIFDPYDVTDMIVITICGFFQAATEYNYNKQQEKEIIEYCCYQKIFFYLIDSQQTHFRLNINKMNKIINQYQKGLISRNNIFIERKKMYEYFPDIIYHLQKDEDLRVKYLQSINKNECGENMNENIFEKQKLWTRAIEFLFFDWFDQIDQKYKHLIECFMRTYWSRNEFLYHLEVYDWKQALGNLNADPIDSYIEFGVNGYSLSL